MAHREIDRNGFEVLPGVVPPVAVAELRVLVLKAPASAWSRRRGVAYAVRNIHAYLDALPARLSLGGIDDTACSILGPRAMLAGATLFDKRPEANCHAPARGSPVTILEGARPPPHPAPALQHSHSPGSAHVDTVRERPRRCGQSDSQLVSPVAHASPQESNATAAVRQSVRRSSLLSARSPTGAATTPTRQQKKASITPYCASS